MLAPTDNSHSAQHSLTWLLDRSAYRAGSANGAENSLSRCIEVAIWTQSLDVRAGAAFDFETKWARGEEVTSDVPNAA
eukprot:1588467-Alexandrium_andersonii.AAC.1